MAEKKTKTKGKKSGARAFQDQELSDKEKAGVKGGGINVTHQPSLGSPAINPTSPNTVDYFIIAGK